MLNTVPAVSNMRFPKASLAPKTPTHQVLPGAGFQVVSEGIRILKCIPTPGEQVGRVDQVLPVDPGAGGAVHHLLLDPLPDLGQRLLLQLQALAVVLPLKGKGPHRINRFLVGELIEGSVGVDGEASG